MHLSRLLSLAAPALLVGGSLWIAPPAAPESAEAVSIQSLADLLRRRGPADDFAVLRGRSPLDGSPMPVQPYLVYDGRWAFVSGGVVVAITDPLRPPVKRGPGR